MLFYPYSSFKPGIEANLSGFLQTPVSLESVDVTFQPLPVLRLLRLSIGEKMPILKSKRFVLHRLGRYFLVVVKMYQWLKFFDASFLGKTGLWHFPMFGGAGASGMRIRDDPDSSV